MHNIKLTSVLRFVSIVIISLIIFLYIMLNTLIDDVVFESGDTESGKEYLYMAITGAGVIPEFTHNPESLFPKPLVRPVVPVIAESIIVSEPASPVDIPSLQFVGMIETSDKTIYSFRNMDTNKLILFEEGVEKDDLTLISEEGRSYTFKKKEFVFQVDKK